MIGHSTLKQDLSPSSQTSLENNERVYVAPARLLRKPEVLHRTGLSNSNLYEKIKAGTFPSPTKLSTRCVAWLESDVDKWIAVLINGGSHE